MVGGVEAGAVVDDPVALVYGWWVRASAICVSASTIILGQHVSRSAVLLAGVYAEVPVVRADAAGQVERIGWLRRVIRVQCPGSCSWVVRVLGDIGEWVTLAA